MVITPQDKIPFPIESVRKHRSGVKESAPRGGGWRGGTGLSAFMVWNAALQKLRGSLRFGVFAPVFLQLCLC